MRAMVFEAVGKPLRAVELAIPTPEPGELLLQIQRNAGAAIYS